MSRKSAVILTVVALLVCYAVPIRYLRLRQTSKDGMIQLVAENVSGKPIAAYVIVMENGAHSQEVHSGVYTGSDVFPAGASVEVAIMPAAGGVTLSIDYVRLADGTEGGDLATVRGKEIASRFHR